MFNALPPVVDLANILSCASSTTGSVMICKVVPYGIVAFLMRYAVVVTPVAPTDMSTCGAALDVRLWAIYTLRNMDVALAGVV